MNTLPLELTCVLFHCAERCTFRLNYPEAFSMKLTTLKKLFHYMFSRVQNVDNLRAVEITEKAISVLVLSHKTAWAEASQCYREKYVDVKYRYELTAAQKKEIERSNRGLLLAVKNAKAKYDRFIKIQNAFETEKQNNQNN